MNMLHICEPGTFLRQSRLFNTNTEKSVLVAMDHSFGGVHKGFELPEKTLRRVLAGDPDGVIVTPGTARAMQHLFYGRSAPAMIISIDYVLFHSFPGDETSIEEQGVVISVEEAIRLGADAIKVLMIFGRKEPSVQARNFNFIGHTCEISHRWGLPVIVEPTTWGHRFSPETTKSPNVLRDMARIAFEFGADIVKIDAPENPLDFSQIADSCPVPLLVLGGAKKQDTISMLHDVMTLMEKGAKGVTFGRNVWQYEEPENMVRALKLVVHNKDIQEALKYIQ